MMSTEATKRDCQEGEQRDRQGDMMSGHQQGDSNYLGSFSNIIPWYIVPNQTNYSFQNTTTTYPMDVPAGFWGRETVLMTPNGTIYLEEFKEVKNCRFIKCHLLTVWVGGGMFIFLKENSQLYKSWDMLSVCDKADNLLHLFRYNRLKISDDFEMTGCFPAMEVTDLIYKPPPEDTLVQKCLGCTKDYNELKRKILADRKANSRRKCKNSKVDGDACNDLQVCS